MYKNSTEQTQLLKVAKIGVNSNEKIISLTGQWNWMSINEKILTSVTKQVTPGEWSIDGTKIEDMDTTGAYFLQNMVKKLATHKIKINQISLVPEDQKIISLIEGIELKANSQVNGVKDENFLDRIAQGLSTLASTSLQLLQFFGHLCYIFSSLFKRNYPIYLAGVMETISSAGIGGIVITTMLAFLLGVNLTYQMSPQFVTYGANVYVVNFLGIAMLREVTPLITSIIVAGRTGSAIAASIGTMKVQEEIDALQTMGISPMRRLVVPKVIGLVIALPVLTMLSDIASMFGGMIFAKPLLGVDYSLFLSRLQAYVSVNNFWVGIIKSFFFAWIIGMIGCFCGFKVKANADSIGIQTTRSVVISISLIVVVDALFAIIFKAFGV